MKQELKIDIPEKMIGDVIRSHMVKALGNKKDFLDAIVKSALEAKKDRYSNTTIYQDELAKMIREVASKTFKEWLDTQKEKIRIALIKRLTEDKEDFINTVCDKILDAMSTSMYINISMKQE